MASTYSNNLKIELMGTGDQSGTWGNTTNTNLGTALEQAIVGYGNPNFIADTDLTISLTDSNASQIARNFSLNVTSSVSLTTTRNLVVPTLQKSYLVYNNTSGSQSITVKTSAGTGVTVPNGARTLVYVDGTNVVSSVSNLPSLTLNTALAANSGGTGNTSYTVGDLIYASTTTTLSKLADVATGNALISGGVGAAPSYGKIVLTTHVTGILPVANGGTGTTSAAYCNLATNVTGTLAVANGGTGITSFGTGVATALGQNVTGSGGIVLATSPALTTPDIGTPTAGTLTSCTGLPISAGTTGTLPVTRGGTGSTSLTANSVVLGNGTSAVQTVAPSTGGNVLTSDGTTWASSAPGQLKYDLYASGTATWTCPTGVTRVRVICVGGGGGGGCGISGTPDKNGGNGGFGGIATGIYTVSPGTGYAVVVGAGGAGSNTGAGSNGSSSSFGSTICSATGGDGADSAGNDGSSGAGSGGVTSNSNVAYGTAGVFAGPTIRARASSSTAALTWSVSSVSIPGAGGQGETYNSDNTVGGVGGVVYLEYIG